MNPLNAKSHQTSDSSLLVSVPPSHPPSTTFPLEFRQREMIILQWEVLRLCLCTPEGATTCASSAHAVFLRAGSRAHVLQNIKATLQEPLRPNNDLKNSWRPLAPLATREKERGEAPHTTCAEAQEALRLGSPPVRAVRSASGCGGFATSAVRTLRATRNSGGALPRKVNFHLSRAQDPLRFGSTGMV